jgi:hypothetical protein
MAKSSPKKTVRSDLSLGIEDVAKWQNDKERDYLRKEKEFERQEADVRAKIQDFQDKLKALGIQKQNTINELSQLGTKTLSRTREALYQGLRSAQALLVERDVLLQKQIKAREERITTLMKTPEMAQKVADYIEFNEDPEAILSKMPPGYRSIVTAHHDQVRKDLEPLFKATNAPLDKVKASMTGLSVVAFVDPPEGKPNALAVLLPIPFSTYSDWATAPHENLFHKLFYRINDALTTMLKKVGVSNIPIQEEEYDEFLLITVYLEDTKVVGDMKTAFNAEIQRIQRSASELDVVQLQLDTIWLSPDVIVPDEGEE